MEEANLDPHKTELLATFSNLTGADDDNALHILEAHLWDLNAAVNFHLEHGTGPISSPTRPSDSAAAGSPNPIVIDGEEEEEEEEEGEEDSTGPPQECAPALASSGPEMEFEGTARLFGQRDIPTAAGVGRPGRDAGLPDLPEGINTEEARMLEAAMFGTAYTGPIPDFSAPRPPSYSSVAAAAADPQLEEQRILRDEQDAAYQASLMADQQRAREEKEKQRAAREQQILEARCKEDEQEAYRLLIEDKRRRVAEEPPPNQDGAIQVQVRLPDGSRMSRAFMPSDPLARLFDFVDVALADRSGGSPDIKPATYTLGMQFPKRVFAEDQTGTLDSNGLNHKQEALFLQPK